MTAPTKMALVPVEATEEMVDLRECPPGPFLFNGSLGFKTEYAEEIPPGSKKWWPGAYCMDSGEFFWGGVSTHEERAKLMVQPVHVAASPSSGRLTAADLERAAEAHYVEEMGGLVGDPPAWLDMSDGYRARAIARMRAAFAAIGLPVEGEQG